MKCPKCGAEARRKTVGDRSYEYWCCAEECGECFEPEYEHAEPREFSDPTLWTESPAIAALKALVLDVDARHDLHAVYTVKDSEPMIKARTLLGIEQPVMELKPMYEGDRVQEFMKRLHDELDKDHWGAMEPEWLVSTDPEIEEDHVNYLSLHEAITKALRTSFTELRGV